MKLLALVFCAAFLAGCNSLDYHAEPKDGPFVYPGVRSDYAGLVNAHSTGMYAPIILGYSAIDMPFSLVVDTLYFPNDVVEVERDKYRQRHPSLQTNNVASQVDTNLTWNPLLSPRQQNWQQ